MTASSTFWYARFLFIRGLGLIYAVAFLGVIQDGLPLLGDNGLTPINLFIEKLQSTSKSDWELMSHTPSLFWFGYSDVLFQVYATLGFLGALSIVCGATNAILNAVVWLFYLSFVSLGQTWFAFGWEMQLIETGFLAIFFCPVFSIRPFPVKSPPSKIVVFAGWWLIARIMLGSALIKLKGASCWTELSCLQYHFETQPIPGPLSLMFHHMPNEFLEWGVLINHFVELVVPFMLLGPRWLRHSAGSIFILFQLILILSGNLAFLNWLTILPCLLCFDDGFLSEFSPRILSGRVNDLIHRIELNPLQNWSCRVYGLLVIVLSIPIVMNLFDSNQSMNRSYFRVPLVNTYGAFGSVSKDRIEITIEGRQQNGKWREYGFPCKPGDLDRQPCWITPMHYRLDWLAWFAGLEASGRGRLESHPWLIHLTWKLLHNDQRTMTLMGKDPFQGEPPDEIRIRVHQYRFSHHLDRLDPEWHQGDVWSRRDLGVWLKAVSRDDPGLNRYVVSQGWSQ